MRVKNSWVKSSQLRSAALWGDGRREFKAKAEVVGGLLAPAFNNLRAGQGVQRGIALHAVNMSGVIN